LSPQHRDEKYNHEMKRLRHEVADLIVNSVSH